MHLYRVHGNFEIEGHCVEIVELLDPSYLNEQPKANFLAIKALDVAREKEKKKSAQSLLEARSKVHEYHAGKSYLDEQPSLSAHRER